MDRREALGVVGSASAGFLGLKGLVPDNWSDEVILNTDYDRMEVGNAVYVTAYTDSGEELTVEYQGPEMDSWETVDSVEDSGEKALSYAFHEEVDEPGDYRFRGVRYGKGLEATSDKEVVEFVDEIESGL